MERRRTQPFHGLRARSFVNLIPAQCMIPIELIRTKNRGILALLIGRLETFDYRAPPLAERFRVVRAQEHSASFGRGARLA
jgi:hypothetical protein